MIQVTARLSSSYQITVPSALRKALDLKAGDEVEMLETEAGVLFKKQESREERIRRLFQELDEMREEREKRMTPEQLALARKTAGWTVKQYHEYLDNLPETKAYIKEKYGV